MSAYVGASMVASLLHVTKTASYLVCVLSSR